MVITSEEYDGYLKLLKAGSIFLKLGERKLIDVEKDLKKVLEFIMEFENVFKEKIEIDKITVNDTTYIMEKYKPDIIKLVVCKIGE